MRSSSLSRVYDKLTNRFSSPDRYVGDQELFRVVDAMIRQGEFDPFTVRHEWPMDYGVYFTCEHLQYLLGEDPYFAETDTRLEFIHFMLFGVPRKEGEGFETVDFLCRMYEATFTTQGLHSGRPPLLHNLLREWMYFEESDIAAMWMEFKIMRLLQLTNDLPRRDINGDTALSVIVSFMSGSSQESATFISRWLAMLSEIGIDLREYWHSEQLVYPGGFFSLCCRRIRVGLVFGPLKHDAKVTITNRVKSRFSTLDPNYMCEAWRGRDRCLSKLDDALVPLARIPGSWEEALKPNSDLTLAKRFRIGWVYSDYHEIEPSAVQRIIMALAQLLAY